MGYNRTFISSIQSSRQWHILKSIMVDKSNNQANRKRNEQKHQYAYRIRWHKHDNLSSIVIFEDVLTAPITIILDVYSCTYLRWFVDSLLRCSIINVNYKRLMAQKKIHLANMLRWNIGPYISRISIWNRKFALMCFLEYIECVKNLTFMLLPRNEQNKCFVTLQYTGEASRYVMEGKQYRNWLP